MIEELIAPNDRADLDRVLQRLLAEWPAVPGAPMPSAEDLLKRCGPMYIDARAAGLPHEDALGSFETGVREYQDAVAAVILGCPLGERP